MVLPYSIEQHCFFIAVYIRDMPSTECRNNWAVKNKKKKAGATGVDRRVYRRRNASLFFIIIHLLPSELRCLVVLINKLSKVRPAV